jgi:glutamate synthase domain-containing protein 2
VHESLARAATECGTYWNTGEGGLEKSLYKYGDHTIVQVASGRFGVHSDYLTQAQQWKSKSAKAQNQESAVTFQVKKSLNTLPKLA